MALETFRVPRTPESRTPYVLALLGAIGLVTGAVRLIVGSAIGVELVAAGLVAAAAVAVVVFVRQRRSPRRP
jgi:hypothetical protein